MRRKKVWFLTQLLLAPFFSGLLLIGCSVEDAYDTPDTEQEKQEQQEQEQQKAKKSSLTIQLYDEQGQPLSGTFVNISDQQFTTNIDGILKVDDLKLGNYTISIAKAGFQSHLSIMRLTEPVHNNTITLEAKSAQQATLLFGGDTMFGRRFMDPSLTTMANEVPSVDDALIQSVSAASSASDIIRFIKPLFTSADFSSVNLESPVLDTPTSVHPTKEFAFFSLPETLIGLNEMGVDYVALGNNHVYDYLEPGLTDTLKFVNEAGFLHSGAGFNSMQAFAPLSTEINGISIGLISGTSITGNANPINYVAEEQKGGAADITNNEDFSTALTMAAANHDFAIVQMHGGDEYSYAPTRYIKNRFEFAARRSIDLAIAHHPHVAQGFAVYDDTPAILGLGNLVFDQNNLETLLGVAVSVSIDNTASPKLQHATAYPIYLEDYQPRLVTGFLSHYLTRRLAEFSDDNVVVTPHDGYATVIFQGPQSTPEISTKTISITPGEQVIDLRALAPSHAFLAQIETNKESSAYFTLGRDMMVFGDFEDWDNDDEFAEVTRWDHDNDDATPCITGAYRHQQGMCLTRTQFDNTPLRLPFRHTIRTMPITPADTVLEAYHELTLFGYAKGDNAGTFNAELTITTAVDSLEFSSQRVSLFPASSYDWQPFSHHFELPDDSNVLGPENLPARGVNVVFTHAPPASGDATLQLDEIALISWQRPLALEAQKWQDRKMHGLDFLRVNSSEPLTLTLSFHSY